MICENCKLQFDENDPTFGTVCPHCLTNHVYYEGKLKEIILDERCMNCGKKYHLNSYWIGGHKKIYFKECPNCKNILQRN